MCARSMVRSFRFLASPAGAWIRAAGYADDQSPTHVRRQLHPEKTERLRAEPGPLTQ